MIAQRESWDQLVAVETLAETSEVVEVSASQIEVLLIVDFLLHNLESTIDV